MWGAATTLENKDEEDKSRCPARIACSGERISLYLPPAKTTTVISLAAGSEAGQLGPRRCDDSFAKFPG